MEKGKADKIKGCLLGGAVGDALGAPVEFLSLDRIISRYGAGGVTGYAEFADGTGKFTDDTQMTLFTADAIIRRELRMEIHGFGAHLDQFALNAYRRWLLTQGYDFRLKEDSMQYQTLHSGWLIKREELFEQRSPGMTCMQSLISGKIKGGAVVKPDNDSKGCGGVMRVAPVGLSYEPREAFENAVLMASVTHGHPSGYLAAGVLASVISFLLSGKNLKSSIGESVTILKSFESHHEVLDAVEKASYSAKNYAPSLDIIEILGKGWVAEEALSIALYCCLCYPKNFEKGVLLSVNHSGDSDSTGSISGNILGAMLGMKSIPVILLENLQCRDIVNQIADDMIRYRAVHTEEEIETWIERYPISL